MGDGKALQMGTSHELGQNFSRAFGIRFADESGDLQFAWQTSWGVSTRLLGALVMTHGDDAGLRLPPALAPVEVVIVVVRDDEGVRTAARALRDDLVATGRRVRLDDRTDVGFGRRSIDWEIKGVPVRLEVGPRDLQAGNVTLVVRHRLEKQVVPLRGAVDRVREVLDQVAVELLGAATSARASRTTEVSSVDEALEASGAGFATIPWRALAAGGEDALGAGAVSVRCLQRPDGSLAEPGDDESELVAVVGRSY